MSMVSASAVVPKAKPTPCPNPLPRVVEIDLNNPPETDGSASPDGDTNEVQMVLSANGSGNIPFCYYSYTAIVNLYNADQGPLNGTFHIRVWVCNRTPTYQGDFVQGFINAYSASFTTPTSWYYGGCGPQADNLSTTFGQQNTGFTVFYRGVGYLNY